jgi:putative 4-mercaptohistidine N1-methyltranferase
VNPVSVTPNPYESDSLLRDYLLFHYGNAENTFGSLPGPREALDFAKRCVTELIAETPGPAAALDIGCAVGGSAFELAKTCQSVLAIDYSRGFIHAAETLARDGRMEAVRLVEAGKFEPFTACVPEGIDRTRVRFAVGDAMNLHPDLGSFDIVLAANLICRLPDPLRFIERLPGLVKPGGQLLLATPFTWSEDYTPVAKWLGRERPCIDHLADLLAPAFQLEMKNDLPFIIREHARKFQYGISLGTRWRRM